MEQRFAHAIRHPGTRASPRLLLQRVGHGVDRHGNPARVFDSRLFAFPSLLGRIPSFLYAICSVFETTGFEMPSSAAISARVFPFPSAGRARSYTACCFGVSRFRATPADGDPLGRGGGGSGFGGLGRRRGCFLVFGHAFLARMFLCLVRKRRLSTPISEVTDFK
jgi:hypothetical protein